MVQKGNEDCFLYTFKLEGSKFGDWNVLNQAPSPTLPSVFSYEIDSFIENLKAYYSFAPWLACLHGMNGLADWLTYTYLN